MWHVIGVDLPYLFVTLQLLIASQERWFFVSFIFVSYGICGFHLCLFLVVWAVHLLRSSSLTDTNHELYFGCALQYVCIELQPPSLCLGIGGYGSY